MVNIDSLPRGSRRKNVFNLYGFVDNQTITKYDLLGLTTVSLPNGCDCNNAPLQQYCTSPGAACGSSGGACETRAFSGTISMGGGGIPYGWQQCVCSSPPQDVVIVRRMWIFWKKYCTAKVIFAVGPTGATTYYRITQLQDWDQCACSCPSGVNCIDLSSSPYHDYYTP